MDLIFAPLGFECGVLSCTANCVIRNALHRKRTVACNTTVTASFAIHYTALHEYTTLHRKRTDAPSCHRIVSCHRITTCVPRIPSACIQLFKLNFN